VGVVYRATSPDLESPVAVKLLHPALSSDEQIVERFEREVVVMERLDHPHIVRHFGGGLMDGQYFYAMELLDHGTLKDRLRQQGPIPWPQAAAYGAQIASALQHAHNHGVIHRDLKPSNLFFAEDGRLVLGDFGIALDVEEGDVSEEGTTVGTYLYMSPEQIRADDEISGKADIYSLGCVMYEMLTGQPPFTGTNFAQIWEKHLHADPIGILDAGINCPLWLERLVLKMLAKDPEHRPFSARAVQGILREQLLEKFGDEADELTKSLPPLATGGDVQRPWLLWVVLAAIVAGLVWASVSQQ
jgi:serine/threonine protein kinase